MLYCDGALATRAASHRRLRPDEREPDPDEVQAWADETNRFNAGPLVGVITGSRGSRQLFGREVRDKGDALSHARR